MALRRSGVRSPTAPPPLIPNVSLGLDLAATVGLRALNLLFRQCRCITLGLEVANERSDGALRLPFPLSSLTRSKHGGFAFEYAALEECSTL